MMVKQCKDQDLLFEECKLEEATLNSEIHRLGLSADPDYLRFMHRCMLHKHELMTSKEEELIFTDSSAAD